MVGEDIHDAMQQWAADLRPEQRAALRRWQGLDQHYRHIQQALRHGIDTIEPHLRPRIEEEIGLIDEAILAGRLPRPARVFRGLRSVENTFGPRWSSIEGHSVPLSGFTGVTTDRTQAEAFTSPEGPGGPAMLVLDLPQGIPIASIAAAGVDELRHQGELLLVDQLRIVVVGVDSSSSPPTLRAEVV